MIAHVVLFRPKSNLGAAARKELIDSLEAALRQIPSVRRARVGPRITHGRGYEKLMIEDFQFAAILEFDDVDGLREYLEHKVHERLAASFFAASDVAMIYDFELGEDVSALARLVD